MILGVKIGRRAVDASSMYMRGWIPALHLGKPRNLGCLHAGPAAYGAFRQAWAATLVNASRRLGAMGLLIAFDLRCSINQQA
jgi:hypothetical protein